MPIQSWKLQNCIYLPLYFFERCNAAGIWDPACTMREIRYSPDGHWFFIIFSSWPNFPNFFQSKVVNRNIEMFRAHDNSASALSTRNNLHIIALRCRKFVSSAAIHHRTFIYAYPRRTYTHECARDIFIDCAWTCFSGMSASGSKCSRLIEQEGEWFEDGRAEKVVPTAKAGKMEPRVVNTVWNHLTPKGHHSLRTFFVHKTFSHFVHYFYKKLCREQR